MPNDQHREDRASRTRRGSLDALVACAVLALCSAIVAASAWMSPARKDAVLQYQQSGQLTYSAAVSSPSIYGPAGLVTGQPIYLSAVSAVQFSYSYLFTAKAPVALSGTEQLVATVSNGQGLARSIPLQAVTAFTGTKFMAKGTLHSAALQSVASQFDRAAGATYQGSYTVSLSPSVTAHGRAGTARLSTGFDTPSQFTYSSGALIPGGTSGSQPSGQTTAQSVTSTGSVTIPGGQDATWLFGLPVKDVRLTALAVLLASLLLAWRVGRPLAGQATSRDEDDRIFARYGSSLVEVKALPTGFAVTTVDLSSFDGLVQVGRRLECPMLYQPGQIAAYGVIDDNTLYRYSKAAAPVGLRAEPAEAGAAPVPEEILG